MKKMLTASAMVRRSLFVLSGEDSTMPRGELEALVETYAPGGVIRMLDRRVAILDGAVDPMIISRRAAYIRLGGVHIGSAEADGEDDFMGLDFELLPRFGSFAARIYDFTGTARGPDMEAELGHAVKEHFPSSTVSLDSPELLIVGVIAGGGLQVCGAHASAVRRDWFKRRPRSRPFFHPSVLYPKFARLLVNLAHVREGETLLDPYCGTASVLVEAGLIGMQSVGVDISKRMCEGALKNLRHLGVEDASVAKGDARFLPVGRVDGVATDLPYGRASSTHRRSPEDIVEDLLDALERVLPTGRYCCVVHLDGVEIPVRRGFEVAQEHKVYIHRQMTRTVTLLRRV
jgi:tRNA (guanine10-N2)-dimethyltransferase